MEFIDQPVTKEVSKEKTHAIRRCILCGHDEPISMFSFTRDFLVKVRNASEQYLKDIKWSDAITSTIVKCKRCGCNYIRDVFIADEDKFACERDKSKMDTSLSKYSQLFTFNYINHLQYSKKIIEILLKHLGKVNKKEISLLDFGSSLSILSLMGRISGFNTVVSYDPKFPPNISDLISKRHPLDINFVKYKDDLNKFAPFDAIVCQSAIEHFYDPQSEIKLMYDLLSEHGILFINNPIMRLDKELKFLKNESRITDKYRLKILRKSYHIDHLNYLTEENCSTMLRNASFKEKKVFFYYANLNANTLLENNIVRLIKAGISYFFDTLGIKYKKVNFFLTKK